VTPLTKGGKTCSIHTPLSHEHCRCNRCRRCAEARCQQLPAHRMTHTTGGNIRCVMLTRRTALGGMNEIATVSLRHAA